MFKYRLFMWPLYKEISASHTNNFISTGVEINFNQFTLNVLDVGFTGKTYKWQLRSKCLKLNFNRSHPTFLFFKNTIFFKRFLKTKFRFFLQSHFDFYNTTDYFYSIRRYNIFTQRGLKIRGLVVFKKRGKVSTYR